MTGPSVYLDYNATAPVRPEVMEVMADAMTYPGNPSSIHAFGRRARGLLEVARASVARAVGTAPAELVFTSGGTEANALALGGLPGPVLVSAVEHPSVLEAVPRAPRIPVDGEGVIRLDALEDLLRSHRPRLVSVMLANNETGVIQPVAEAARLAHAHGALLHTDAVQALGKIPVDLAALGADLASLSAHKIGGPPGTGALAMAKDASDVPLQPRQRGGGQEHGRRAGTEALPAIAGFAQAVALMARLPDLVALRDRLEQAIAHELPEARILGQGAARLPNTCCVLLPGMPAATRLIALDLDGIAVSSGAACSSGKVGPSHVLRAMGLPPEEADHALRISLGWASSARDVDRLLASLRHLARRDRSG